MVINLSPELEAALNELARKQGISLEELALNSLRERFLKPAKPFEPQDDWERKLLELGTDCGVSLPDEALGRDEIYD